MSLLLLIGCIAVAFMSGALFIGGKTKSKEYYVGSAAGLLVAIFLGVCLVGEVTLDCLGMK